MILCAPLNRRRFTRRISVLTLVLLSMVLAGQGHAEDLPVFRSGLWEFKRSMEDNSGMYRQTRFTRQKCADPTSDLRKTNEKMAAQGCSFSPLLKTGDSYEGTSACEAPRSRMESHIILAPAGDGAYRLMITSRGEQGSTTEEVVARRLGDCPAKSRGH